jgi:YfiH family protein
MPPSAPLWLRRLPSAAAERWQYGWTTGAGPDFRPDVTSAEHANAVDCLVAAVGLAGGAWVRQVHGGTVLRAEQPGYVGEADALWTTTSGLGVVGRSADCPLVLVAGADASGNGRWGFAHASWRSTVAGITLSLLREMIRSGLRPDRARAVICPSAGPCCYEVGAEVRQDALCRLGPQAADFFAAADSRFTFDLWRANGAQLEASGLPGDHIHTAEVCTICGGDDYPSYRREQDRAGRFAAISGGDS